jgi:hypothetical protein
LLTLFLGSVILLISLLFLASIWKESMIATAGGQPKMPWVRIINANWTTRLVTIFTAVIRTVVAYQASLATAMLAGIILETIGIPIFHAPLYSTIRALNVSPINLLPAIKSRSGGVSSSVIYAIILIEILMALASQFLSTILMSDFADGTFIKIINSIDVPILIYEYVSRENLWLAPPASSWTFAELAEPLVEGTNFHDTGHTYRTFLPFEDDVQRTRLRKFRGPVPIMDQRMVCASPFLVNLTLDTVSMASVRLTGQMTLDNSTLSAMLQGTDPSQHYINFTCALPAPLYWTNTTVGESSLCFPNLGDMGWLLKDALVDPTPNDTTSGSPEASTGFIVIDVLSTEAIRNGLGATKVVETVRNDGPWAMVSNGSETEALRITSCFTNLGVETFVADMNSSWDGLEPKLSWDRQAQGYNTEMARRQLGASLTPETFHDRGILVLGPRSQWQSFTNESSDTPWIFLSSLKESLPLPQFDLRPANDSANSGVILSKRNTGDDSIAHLTHVDMFQDTLIATGSPALATQALFARVLQMAYYEQLVKLGTTAAATASVSTTVFIPVRWTGFTVAAVLVALHVLIVAIVTVLFQLYTTSSLLGNHWQAVSQVVSQDTLPILQEADSMQDKEVQRWAKFQNIDLSRSSLVRLRSDKRIALSIKE